MNRSIARYAWVAALLAIAATCLVAQAPAGRGRGAGRGVAATGRGGAAAVAPAAGPGPADKQVVDPVAADRGKTVYLAECITCHGSKARGSSEGAPPDLQGPDLIRSSVVQHDRVGDHLEPFLKKGHPMQSGKASSGLTQDQIQDLSHFLKQRFNDTLNRGPGNSGNPAPNIVTGDAKAGAVYFNVAGKCNTCHSPTGDLAGIAGRFDAVTIQQRFLFPAPGRGGGRGAPAVAPGAADPAAAPKVVTWTVTLADGTSVTGTPIRVDDFDVQLRDAAGDYHSWKRVPAMKLVKNDPFAAHSAMLSQYTDKNIHDIVAFLETLK